MSGGLLATPPVGGGVRSGQDHWSTAASPSQQYLTLRRNSFDQPFSPLLGSANSAGDGALRRASVAGAGRRWTTLSVRGRPSLLQLATFAMAAVALWRSFANEASFSSRFSSFLRFTPSASSSSSTSSNSPSLPPSPLHNTTGILGLSSVVVGPRSLPPQYHRTPGACNSTSLLRAVSLARIRANGASRKVDYTVPSDAHTLRDFRFSYDLAPHGCAEPHLYTKEEACDLLRAYGGVMLRGDSFVRHVTNALFILLSGRQDGAVLSEGERCRGNAMFDDRKAHCREMSVTNSQTMPEPVCGGDVPIFFELNSWGAQPPHLSLSAYDQWRWSLPPSRSILSHIHISGFGLHHHLNSLTGIQGFVRPYLHKARQIFPRPVGLWFGIHAPAPGKPERWVEEQGEKNVKRYNREVGSLLDALAPGEFVEESAAMKMVDWYNSTDGAESYDGSHYSYQVNMEKVLILLNLLDTIWGEAVEAGGLLETF